MIASLRCARERPRTRTEIEMIDLPWGLKSSEAIPLPASIDRSAFNASLQSNNTRLVTWPKAFPADNFVGDFSRRVRLSASESIIFHGVDQFISTLKALAPNTRINCHGPP